MSAALLKMDAATGFHYGFPPPHVNQRVRDGEGREWLWLDEHPVQSSGAQSSGFSRPLRVPASAGSRLGDFGDLGSWVTPVSKGASLAGAGLGIAGGLAAGTAFGAIAGPVGAILGLVGGLISGIFGAHSARVAQENKISGQWAAGGPQTISQIVAAWQQGQLSSSDASTALDQVYAQFLQQNQSITKLNGQYGAYPDPNAPRPSSNCNWACGTSWDLNQELQGLKAQIGAGDPTGLGSGALSGILSDPLALAGIGILIFLMVKK